MTISFQFKGRRRTALYLKYPADGEPPQGDWECVCGQINKFNGADEIHCVKCGTKLRITRNQDERQRFHTLVRVGHVDVNGQQGGPIAPNQSPQ